MSIDIRKEGGNIHSLECDKLVIAAGPWTPATFKMLFPKSSVRFENAICAGDWYVFDNPQASPEESIAAVYFNDIVGHKLEFAGRNDGTIWATGEKSQTGEVPRIGHAPQPDPEYLAKLKRYADVFLKGPLGDRVITQGRSYRPATRSGLPIISGVPASKLSPAEGCDGADTSVYINSGHGSYGVTLGMGSGKLMSQLVLGQDIDLDISKFGLSYAD